MQSVNPISRRVVIADDQPHVRRIVSAKLEKAGFQVWVAEDGEEALTLAREHKPDVLIADYRMPRLDGMDLCRMLQQDAQTSSIPVVLLTAYDAQVLEQPLGNTNIRAMLSKPFSVSDVLRVVTGLIDDQAAMRAAS